MNDEGRQASQQQWGESAEAWARAAEEPDTGGSAAAAEWMLEAVDLQAGESVLELACGAGRVGLQAAALVGPEGRVVCSDFAEPMVEAVQERIERLALRNVEARVLDAEDLDLADGERFDAVLCRFGYMLMGDPQRALAESMRALVPGGRLSLAVWGREEHNPWLTPIFEAVMDHFGAPPPEPGTPGPFALGDPARLRSMLEHAGFDEVSVAELDAEQTYDSPTAWWEGILAISAPIRALVDSLGESDAGAIRERALGGAAGHVSDDGRVILPSRVVGALARRPR